MRSQAAFPALASACSLLLAACGGIPASAPRPLSQEVHHAAPPAAKPYSDAVPNGPPHPGAPGNIEVTLPVKQIPTSFAAEESRAIPSSVTVSIPASWQGAVAAYWAGVVLLGPAGWTGKGVFGADGSGGITLYPPGGSPSSGPLLSISTAGGCLGCGDGLAAEFFAYVRQSWSQFRIINGPAPKPAKVLSQVALSPNVVAYRLPNSPSGLQVNGVAYSGLVHHASGLPFEQMNAVLPAGDHALATVALNYFLANDLASLP